MVSITPNTYLYTKTAFKLRKYLIDNRLISEIIDFKDAKVFDGVSVYCCITVFTKKEKSEIIYNDEIIQYSELERNYSLFNSNSSEKTLKDMYKIKNGIATLRDKIFIHGEKLYDEPCWKSITNNIMNKYIIYPYENGKILDEHVFKKNNPLTYDYLVEHKNELAKRDKGKKKYPAWYAYGRSQTIVHSDKTCVFVPCFVNSAKINTNVKIRKGMLFYSCVRIEPDDENDVNTIVNVIRNNTGFIISNSTKRSGGWINISSRVLYQIPLN
ncbi:putative N6 adenine-specific DNA methyltransferase [Heterosigma akashiwo virus 01]|jgi:adenine-specific DNA-methyltransferase|uniref:site-specific DNA-methyltransferase (adenine-specific) n=1 Tax=Heterosigma akashiwo virus 01 TaxID=97195 RepID=A0A1C9C5K0_HAV01|nr:putative N6 adenine-specific DNA methyltransferase [Heterosigma akashiwo virus 01]AOM63555.1 putative N6 adenine-specific DNA methyltransferase [Heterosigma akashiwo virus 01]